MIYCVKPVVCDYGVFECVPDKEDSLIVICNSSDNANMIAEILNVDLNHEIWKPKGSETELKPTKDLINDLVGFDVSVIEPLPEFKENEDK